jgi:hypothetical protein
MYFGGSATANETRQTRKTESHIFSGWNLKIPLLFYNYEVSAQAQMICNLPFLDLPDWVDCPIAILGQSSTLLPKWVNRCRYFAGR